MTIEKPSRNEDEYFVRREAELLQQRREAERRAALEAERKTHFMKCPKDGYDLASSEYHGVQIEMCPHCGGMWLDAGELEAIERHDMDHPGLLTRVLTDAFASFRGSGSRRASGPAAPGSGPRP